MRFFLLKNQKSICNCHIVDLWTNFLAFLLIFNYLTSAKTPKLTFKKSITKVYYINGTYTIYFVHSQKKQVRLQTTSIIVCFAV